MLIWPFLALTFLLLFGLGYLVFNLEKSVIINNWDKRRCELGVIAAASYFKSNTDPRSDTQFSIDNFSFCTGKFVEKTAEILFSPLQNLFSTTTGSIGIISQGIEIIRTVLSKIKQQFEEFMNPLYQKYIATSYAIFGIFQHFRAAFERTNAIVLGMLFASLSIIRGMLNMKDFVVKIVLIILGIMVAAIVILFFVLFPFIPIIILPTIAAIEVAVGSGAVSGMRDAFCLAPGTLVKLPDNTWKYIENIQPGDGNGFIEAAIEMDGKNVELWNINEVIISSYHIVWDNTIKKWVFAKNHSNAKKILCEFNKLYCLTTKTRKICVSGTSNGSQLIIRDWEELEHSDKIGNKLYESIVSKLHSELNIVSSISMPAGSIPSNLFYKISGNLERVIDFNNKTQMFQIGSTINENDRICGRFSLAESPEYIWIHDNGKIYKYYIGTNSLTFLNTPITESGQINLYDSDGNLQYIIQDMTEVGVSQINKTYNCILSRLNSD